MNDSLQKSILYSMIYTFRNVAFFTHGYQDIVSLKFLTCIFIRIFANTITVLVSSNLVFAEHISSSVI